MLVKTHAWSDAWDARRAAHVLVTHRDLRAVVASYRRMGWAADLKAGYVRDHLRWRVRFRRLRVGFRVCGGPPAGARAGPRT